MRRLELLAPARNADIGIAAIDCGADAVYMAGPQFGARQAAGNSIDDIRRLCDYAHRYGVRIFVTLNTILFDSELGEARQMMLQLQEAGADAIIVQDMAVPMMAAGWKEDGTHGSDRIRIPLHASTQCAIRTPEQAVFLESIGFSRLILERELSLKQIKAIRDAVGCELEFFVHGALCVCYSGQCYLSEHIAGRSANRGACIQACRSRYDLMDSSGRTLVRNRSLLSLKDYSLKDRIEDLAEAGVVSFKIEGRLKNGSYVKNVVRDYSLALDGLVARHPEKYARASYGHVTEGFMPDPVKTFNRGYTELFLDGKRGNWASGDSAKGMGEEVGTVSWLNGDKSSVRISPKQGAPVRLSNGDGFSFVSGRGEAIGFRGDVCEGHTIRCKPTPELYIGARLFRNIDAAFERTLAKDKCLREIRTEVDLTFRAAPDGTFSIEASAATEDGRTVRIVMPAGDSAAKNRERMEEMLRTNISKSSGIYRFSLNSISFSETDAMPFMPASSVNAVRRALAEELDSMPCIMAPLSESTPLDNADAERLRRNFRKFIPDGKLSYKANVSNHLAESLYRASGAEQVDKAYELTHENGAELMRTKYCIRHELGLCLKKQRGQSSDIMTGDGKPVTDLFLVNNGRRLTLHFDCRNCEMVVR